MTSGLARAAAPHNPRRGVRDPAATTPKEPRVQIHLFTIGFTQKSAEEFFNLLKDAGVKKLLDIREKRTGQLAGFAKGDDLPFFLERLLGVDYAHEPLLAPTRELRTRYLATKDWDYYEPRFLALLEERNVAERVHAEPFAEPTVLLCACATADRCHRRLVADFLADSWIRRGHAVEITHLELAKKPRSRANRARP